MMLLRSIIFLFFCSSLYSQVSKEAYFDYLEKYPHTLGPFGDHRRGEIEIIQDPQKIVEIEQVTGRDVGVVAEDKYWIWFNDAVQFPNGKSGVYGRIAWRQSLEGIAGVAVMPMLSDGRICLSRTFRHATRSWEYELPRGGLNHHETIEEAALRETHEETGLIAAELIFLGYMNPDSGTSTTVVPIFLAKICGQGNAHPEDSEAISGIDPFTINQIKQGFIDGYLRVEVDGVCHTAYLRDPFLAFALLQHELRKNFVY